MKSTLEEIIIEHNGKTKTSLIVCISMLVAGVILLVVKYSIGWLFVIMGAIHAVTIYNGIKKFNDELAKVNNIDELSRELSGGDAKRFELLTLTLTDHYAVVEKPWLQIYPLKDMVKFEVGLAGDARKALFLTDRNGVRHKIAETQKGDAMQEEFDKAYECVREYFHMNL